MTASRCYNNHMAQEGIQISLKINGADRVQIGVRNIGAAIPTATRQDVLDAMQGVRDSYTGSYSGGYSVAELPNQGYERTGNWGASTYVYQDGSTARIRSEAISPRGHPYSELLVGNASGAGQAAIHAGAGRWPLMADQVAAAAEALLETIDATLSQIIRQQGLGGEAGGL